MSKHAVRKTTSLWDPAILRPAAFDSFKKLDPRLMARNPVMFVVEVGCVLVTVLFVYDLARGAPVDVKFNVQLILWLWFTVLFANFAEAMAEGRGKAQAATLRKMRTTTMAARIRKAGDAQKLTPGDPAGNGDEVPATDLKRGDVVLVRTGTGRYWGADGHLVGASRFVDIERTPNDDPKELRPDDADDRDWHVLTVQSLADDAG